MLRVTGRVLAVCCAAYKLIKLFDTRWVVLIRSCSLILVENIRLRDDVFNFIGYLLPDGANLRKPHNDVCSLVSGRVAVDHPRDDLGALLQLLQRVLERLRLSMLV